MELKDTVDMMLSEDYKERFKAEYWQAKIRKDKLEKIINNWFNLDFSPTCSLALLIRQYNYMDDYLYTLKERAKVENINLEEK